MPHVNFQLRTNILDHELEVPAEIPRGSNQVQKEMYTYNRSYYTK